MLKNIIKSTTLALLVGSMTVGCGTPKKGDNADDPKTTGAVTAKGPMAKWDANRPWYLQPSTIKKADGMYGFGGHPAENWRQRSAAVNFATDKARTNLAGNIKIKIQAMVKQWAEDSGDSNDAQTISNLFRSESFSRTLVNTTLKQLRTVREYIPSKAELPDEVFVLVELRPKEFARAVKKVARDEAKQNRTAAKTRYLSKKAENDMDAFIDKEEKKMEKTRVTERKQMGFPPDE
jgi:hypothetical protein